MESKIVKTSDSIIYIHDDYVVDMKTAILEATGIILNAYKRKKEKNPDHDPVNKKGLHSNGRIPTWSGKFDA